MPPFRIVGLAVLVALTSAALGGVLGAWSQSASPAIPSGLSQQYERVRLRLLVARPSATAPDGAVLYGRLLNAVRLAAAGEIARAETELAALEAVLAREASLHQGAREKTQKKEP